jgi:prepilin-type N-terminal cleavage/methylation domain-containing protein
MRKRRKGFTLIEVVLALAILAVATTMLVTAGGRSLARLAESRQMRSAGVAAQRKFLELAQTAPPTLEEETAWAPLGATSDLGIENGWWMKRVRIMPVVPGQLGAQDPDTLRLLEVSVRLGEDAQAPVYRLATLYPPPPAP